MIKLLHTSDWHLGRELHGKRLIEDQTFALEQLLQLIDETQPDALLIAGDIFDRPLPPESAVKLFDSFLSRAIVEKKIPVLVIPGNHDSAERLGFASKLLRERGLTIFARPEDSLVPVEIKGKSDGAKALVYGIPFVEPAMIGEMLGSNEIRTIDRAVNELCRTIISKHDAKVPAILICHSFVVGGEASDSERDLFVGGSAYVDVKAFEGFAYTALGHLHKPQRAGSERVRYSGSLLPYSKSEIGGSKAVLEVRIDGDQLDIKEHTLPVLRELRYLEGTLENLLAGAAKDSAREDYIIAGYTDSGPVLDAGNRLRALYPNLLHIGRTGGFTPSELPAAARLREREKLSELDLFAQFFKETTGEDLNDDERKRLSTTIESLERAEGR